MRILDKNTDFYDFYQNIYRDNTVTFDRTNSFMLTKDMVRSKISVIFGNTPIVDYRFALLQVCNTFWLFSVHIDKIDGDARWDGKVSKYSVKLLKKWDNFSAKRCLILFNLIYFDYGVMNHAVHFDGDSCVFKDDILADAVNNGQYRRDSTLGIHDMKNSNNDWRKGALYNTKTIPILIASGFAEHINPLDIYLAFEQYFSLERQSTERTESIGLTDKEKIESHGFDTKTSFRGKQ